MSSISIKTKEVRFPVEKNLYGIFYEDINRAGDGGLYPEMIRNRSFEDSLAPTDCTTEDDGYALVSPGGWRDQFNHGEGLTRWIVENGIEETPIPAWYADGAEMVLDQEHPLNEHRMTAMKAVFTAGGSIRNTGYTGMGFKKNAGYDFYMFISSEEDIELEIGLYDQSGALDVKTLTVSAGDYTRYDLSFQTDREGDTASGCLKITAPKGGTAVFGFLSLMPQETFKGHGLRKDLGELLYDLKPAFMRFPGGCIVEGFSWETMNLFEKSVGPVWERPSQLQCWHYRSTNGLGFHEYLQLCEDLGAKAMYVFNCGMTCQARKELYYEGDELEFIIQDTMNALEYAMGDVTTKWGALRAEMGHPEPFSIEYLSIGNENSGEGYEKRYQMCYDRIHAAYPQIRLIANAHIEKHGYPADLVDEHYYNTAEYFAENADHFDHYERTGLKLLLGEVSVVKGWIGQHFAALGEACFLLGIERNQDLIELLAYAPLFENVNYRAWFPDLIRFNQKESFGIPSYSVWKLFGENRGDDVIQCAVDTDVIYHPLRGCGSLLAPEGLKAKNALWNGQPVEAAHEILGHYVDCGDHYELKDRDAVQIKDAVMFSPRYLNRDKIVFGPDDVTAGEFSVDVYVEKDQPFAIGIYSAATARGIYMPDETNPPKKWNVEDMNPYAWEIKDGISTVYEPDGPFRLMLAEPVQVDLQEGYHTFSWKADGKQAELKIDGTIVQVAKVQRYDVIHAFASQTEDTVLVKCVNMSENEQDVQITLDTEVESAYEVQYVAQEKSAENSFENPKNVTDKRNFCEGASNSFIYKAPALSAAVLKLKKK